MGSTTQTRSETDRGRRLLVAVLGVLILLGPAGCEEESASSTGVAQFVDRSACLCCHPEQAVAWKGSDHDLAMQEATKATVLGNFDDVRFTHEGAVTRFFRKGNRFFIRTPGPAGKVADFEVRYTFGVEPLQQYLLVLDSGRLQAFDVAWDRIRQRWFSLYATPVSPGDPRHWSGRLLNWNSRCAACHATNLDPGFDPAGPGYRTTFSEIDVGCQACHGPGSLHVAWAARSTEPSVPPQPGRGLVTRFSKRDPRGEVEVCARCHARRQPITRRDHLGEPLLDHYLPALLREGLYYADGQILDEVYVYGSFVQSRMYRAGVRCSDCHDPHSGRLRVIGNTLCVGCHAKHASQRARFPTLRSGDYDSPAHHFHPPGRPGSFCVDCHMPARRYMGIDPRRDHGLRIPRPVLSQAIGAPDPCRRCHSDRSAVWAEREIARRYRRKTRSHTGTEFPLALAAGRAGRSDAVPALIRTARDLELAPIVRASAVGLLGHFPGSEVLQPLLDALEDEDPLVRVTALSGLDARVRTGGERTETLRRVEPMAARLSDPIRAVRIEAARVLSQVSSDRLTLQQRSAFERALEEFEQAQSAQADLPEAHLSLGVVYSRLGQDEKAQVEYRTALRLDPTFDAARFNLATLYDRQDRKDAAEKELRAILKRDSDNAQAHYSLGLLLAETGRLEAAEEHLSRAAERLPQRARIRYNHGLALQRLGRRAEAEAALSQANEADPADPAIVYALVVLYVQEERWVQAQPRAEKLVDLVPESAPAQDLLARIRRELSRSGGP